MTNNFRLTFSVGGHYTGGLQLVLSKTKRVGDTKYNILCSYPEHSQDISVSAFRVSKAGYGVPGNLSVEPSYKNRQSV